MSNQHAEVSPESAIAVEIEDLHRRLEILARNSRWPEFAEAIKRRDELLVTISGSERASVFQATVRSNERLLKLARAGRQAIADQLTSLRHGREMAGRYEQHRQLADSAD